tara:strand:- start:33433 stop:33735 length:303 start_codon:yes stop_codon:yes gene_type:complete
MFDPPDQDKMDSEADIRLFLRIFPLLAAHFEFKTDAAGDLLLGMVGTGGLTGIFQDPARALAEKYEEALEDETYDEESFVDSLPSVISMPSIKKPILEDE